MDTRLSGSLEHLRTEMKFTEHKDASCNVGWLLEVLRQHPWQIPLCRRTALGFLPLGDCLTTRHHVVIGLTKRNCVSQETPWGPVTPTHIYCPQACNQWFLTFFSQQEFLSSLNFAYGHMGGMAFAFQANFIKYQLVSSFSLFRENLIRVTASPRWPDRISTKSKAINVWVGLCSPRTGDVVSWHF